MMLRRSSFQQVVRSRVPAQNTPTVHVAKGTGWTLLTREAAFECNWLMPRMTQSHATSRRTYGKSRRPLLKLSPV